MQRVHPLGHRWGGFPGRVRTHGRCGRLPAAPPRLRLLWHRGVQASRRHVSADRASRRKLGPPSLLPFFLLVAGLLVTPTGTAQVSPIGLPWLAGLRPHRQRAARAAGVAPAQVPGGRREPESVRGQGCQPASQMNCNSCTGGAPAGFRARRMVQTRPPDSEPGRTALSCILKGSRRPW